MDIPYISSKLSLVLETFSIWISLLNSLGALSKSASFEPLLSKILESITAWIVILVHFPEDLLLNRISCQSVCIIEVSLSLDVILSSFLESVSVLIRPLEVSPVSLDGLS